MGERHNIIMEEGGCQEIDPCCLAILDPRVGVIFRLSICVFTVVLDMTHEIVEGVCTHSKEATLSISWLVLI